MTDAPPAPAAKRRRGRESALDMVRTLAVVFALVVPLWFFGQASPSDSKRIRPVDATETYKDFAAATGGPSPATPTGWVPNVQEYDGAVARVGYVLGEHYMEWQGGNGSAWVYDATGKGQKVGTEQVGAVTWEKWQDGDGHVSLVRAFGTVTELVGGLREKASDADLQALAATVR